MRKPARGGGGGTEQNNGRKGLLAFTREKDQENEEADGGKRERLFSDCQRIHC
ncbi:MAG: hypothetical protein GF329_20140 [Candidatus Lokiarchaeota archaeon]|nr:hypothetical protein [Candidatus Lokiarchaeota archaeon]